ncbi:MAG: hypothetical protein DHS20C15_16860 [Planctomycetota bacterium]|nr:MAG: hypothetical protein DHS20C15_16860 [Planctomycetota bacterium]
MLDSTASQSARTARFDTTPASDAPRTVAAAASARFALCSLSAPFLVFCALLGGCGPSESEPDHHAGPPHVILISVDALRQDHLGLYGYERDTSPWLDDFAEQSVVFERAYTAGTWTLISHMSMFTGLYPEQHGIYADGTRLADEIPTLAERLQARGYHTASLYYEGWIHERFGFDRGFDVVRHHEEAQAMARHARELLDTRPPDQPLFLFLHAWDVHSARMNQDSGSTIYNPPSGYDTLWVPDARERLDGVIKPVLVYKGKLHPTPEQREAIVALYDGNVRYVDDVLGEILGAYEEAGLLDNALVIVTSDHGEALNQREGYGGHGDFFEEGLRVPLVMRFPRGAGAGTRRSETVSLVDLLPTVLDELGAPREPWLQGLPLQHELPRDRMILLQRPPKSALLQWPWKLRWKTIQDLRRAQLYNLEDDPEELAPLLWHTHRARFDEMVGALAQVREKLMASWAPVPGDVVPGSAPTPEEIQLLEELGYLGDG